MPAGLCGADHAPRVSRLRAGQETEVLSFLSARPLQTVFMSGFVRDNGLEGEANRGDFYGCRDLEGRLVGVALIGHATLFETRTRTALAAFAQVARTRRDLHMIMAERGNAARFWKSYAGAGQAIRLACRELLYALDHAPTAVEVGGELRPATPDMLSLIAPVHARMAFEESGVNPLETDKEGFLRRCARRIEAGQVYALVQDGRLVFKADVFASTPEAAYLEGVYVAPEARGRGYGLRSLSQLSRILLAHTRSIAVLVNEKNAPARNLYERAGFARRGEYDTFFLSGS